MSGSEFAPREPPSCVPPVLLAPLRPCSSAPSTRCALKFQTQLQKHPHGDFIAKVIQVFFPFSPLSCVCRSYPRCTSRSPSNSFRPFLPGCRRVRRSCSRRACSGPGGTDCSGEAESRGPGHSHSRTALWSGLSGLVSTTQDTEVF